MSDPREGLPAWIEFRWAQPCKPIELQLVFDTGLHRVLTMSHDDAYTARMQWGRPQAETACDYTIEGWKSGAWQMLASITCNYQRRRVHRLQMDEPIGALRLTIVRMHGLDHARLCEARVYAAERRWISSITRS